MDVTDLWKKYAADFDAMTDAQIDRETLEASDRIDADTEWVDAVTAWEAAGKPRKGTVA